MDTKVLKNFINHDVELLVGGVWIKGHMTPIVEGTVTLLPIGEDKVSYGPTACKAEVIQAARQLRTQQPNASSPVPTNPNPPPPVHSAFAPHPNAGHPGNKYVFPNSR